MCFNLIFFIFSLIFFIIILLWLLNGFSEFIVFISSFTIFGLQSFVLEWRLTFFGFLYRLRFICGLFLDGIRLIHFLGNRLSFLKFYYFFICLFIYFLLFLYLLSCVLCFWRLGLRLVLLFLLHFWHYYSFSGGILFLIFIFILIWRSCEFFFRCVRPLNCSFTFFFFLWSNLKHNWFFFLWFCSLVFLLLPRLLWCEFRVLLFYFTRYLLHTFWCGFTCEFLWLSGGTESSFCFAILSRSFLFRCSFSFLTLWVHLDEVWRVDVDTERNEFFVIIVYWVKVFQEEISKQEITIVMWVKRILSDCELANFSLMQVSSGAQLEDGLSNLECNRLDFFGDLRAAFATLAECLVCFAVQIGEVVSPLILEHMVLLRRNS